MHSLASKDSGFRAKEQVYSLLFSADQHLLFLSSPTDKEVQVWDWASPSKPVRSLTQPTAALLNSLRLSSDGRSVASVHLPSASNQIVSFWDAAEGGLSGVVAEPHSGISPLTYASAAFVPSSAKVALVLGGGNFKKGPSQEVYDGLFVYDSVRFDRLWSLNTEPIRPVALGVSHDGKWAAVVGWDRVIVPENPSAYARSQFLLIDLDNRHVAKMQTILGRNCDVTFVTWSAGDERIAIGGNCLGSSHGQPPAFEIVDWRSSRPVGDFPAKSHLVGLDYSANGKYLVVAWSRLEVEIWNADHTKSLETISGDPTAIALSANGTHLAIAENLDVSVWTLK